MNAPIHKLKLFFYLSLVTCSLSCSKNYTKFFEDEDNKNLSIFSNKNFNVASCYINNQPWRSKERRSSGFAAPRISTEIQIGRIKTNSASDTLILSWLGEGSLSSDITNIYVSIPVAKDFSYKTLNQFNRQRIVIDGNTGYFQIETPTIESKGKGVIYFHTLQIDSSNFGYSGKLSGLFEAQTPGNNITKGRFDHSIMSEVMFMF